jgi:hypothetical protein
LIKASLEQYPQILLSARAMDQVPKSGTYKHSQKSVQRPDVGVEAQFSKKKPPKTYRYNSSLAPELCWDESPERPFAEWLLNIKKWIDELNDLLKQYAHADRS